MDRAGLGREGCPTGCQDHHAKSDIWQIILKNCAWILRGIFDSDYHEPVSRSAEAWCSHVNPEPAKAELVTEISVPHTHKSPSLKAEALTWVQVSVTWAAGETVKHVIPPLSAHHNTQIPHCVKVTYSIWPPSLTPGATTARLPHTL